VAAVGVLKPGVSLANAARDIEALAKWQEQTYPTTNKGFGIELQTLRDQFVGTSRQPIYIVFGVVIVVLFIACANVANLQLERGVGRRSRSHHSAAAHRECDSVAPRGRRGYRPRDRRHESARDVGRERPSG